jgi:hypothetical protein
MLVEPGSLTISRIIWRGLSFFRIVFAAQFFMQCIGNRIPKITEEAYALGCCLGRLAYAKIRC